MYYLDYAKRVGDRHILNFFADSEEDLKDVPTSTPYITRNGTNYGIPLETSVVTIIEKGVKVNYVLQNGEYIAGGDVAPVVGKLEATENKTYLAKDANLDGYSQVVVNVQPALQEKTVDLAMASGNQIITPDSGYDLSKATVTKPSTFVAGNIKKGVNIGGITGTLETQKEEEAGTATITENGSQTFSPTSGKVFSDFTVTTNVPTGVNTGDATAVASDILSGKTAYAKGVKLTGSVEWYNGAFVVNVLWKASVSNLGATDPNTVVFNTPTDSVSKPWSEVEFNGDVFIKFPKMYRKIVTVTNGQITAFEIANKKIDNDYKLYPCFIDESGNELDYILVGKYMSKSSDTCNSVATGELISQTIGNGREKARARGIGYQLMDWRVHRLWQDLIICAMETVNTNNGEGIETDRLGIYWGEEPQFIDGVQAADSGQAWIYSNHPSKYTDNPTSETDGYITTTYTAPIVAGGPVKILGYEMSEASEFFNYPAIDTGVSPSFETYYCDQYTTIGDSGVLGIWVGNKEVESGAFNSIVVPGWEESACVRLCYRPISS